MLQVKMFTCLKMTIHWVLCENLIKKIVHECSFSENLAKYCETSLCYLLLLALSTNSLYKIHQKGLNEILKYKTCYCDRLSLHGFSNVYL